MKPRIPLVVAAVSATVAYRERHARRALERFAAARGDDVDLCHGLLGGLFRFGGCVGGCLRRVRGRAVVVITHLVFEEERFDVLYELREGRAVRRERARA